MPRYKLYEHNVFGHAVPIAESVTALTFPDDTPTDEQYRLIGLAHKECIAVLRDEAFDKLAAASTDVDYYSIDQCNGVNFPVYVTRADLPASPVLH